MPSSICLSDIANTGTVSKSAKPNESLAAPTIEEVLNALQIWRKQKTKISEPIPDPLLKKIFTLAKTHSDASVRRIFGLSKKQYQSHFERLNPPKVPELKSAPIEFCQAKISQTAPKLQTTPKKKPAYEPAKTLATHTVVVEFYRPDGYLMKIHTTTDNFQCLMQAFAQAVVV